jgi:NAD(P)-dependent dehydrogenase (short-subunit alcohol dehydrogenase family)
MTLRYRTLALERSMNTPTPGCAVVTGAGSGIGRGCAQALIADGWRVAFVGRRIEALEASIAGCGAGRDRAIALPADVGDPASVAALFDAVAARFGRLDLLFNNAGVSSMSALLEDLAFAEWQASVAANLTGTFLCTQQAFRLMKAQAPMGGRIINNGSISAHAPRPNSIAYTATKHAVTGITKTASLDGRKYNIAVGQIDIGNVASDMTTKMVGGVPQADGSVKPEPRMAMASVVSTFMTMARLPLDANILNVTVMASAMPFVGRG